MVGIREVAAQAGVSTATVSHVLNDTRFVKRETRDRIHAVMAALGYQPNGLARSLRRNETRTIGVVVTDVANPFFTPIVRGIEDTAQASGYSVILCNSDESADKERRYLQVLAAKRVDGLIVAPTGRPSPELAGLYAAGKPIIYIDRRPAEANGPRVTTDSVAAARAAVDHLVRDGHRRIAIVTASTRVSTNAERLRGYREALTAHAIPYEPRLAHIGRASARSGENSVRRLLAQSDRPTALLSTNNHLTLGALAAIRAARLTCPDDVALVGFDDPDWAAIADPALTVVKQPTREMGTHAARLLISRLQTRAGAVPDVLLPTQLIVRASCSTGCAQAFRHPRSEHHPGRNSS